MTPISVSTSGPVLSVSFPDGHSLRLDNTDKGWERLRKIVRAMELESMRGIGTKAKPVQHTIDTQRLQEHLEAQEEKKRKQAEAEAFLAELMGDA